MEGRAMTRFLSTMLLAAGALAIMTAQATAAELLIYDEAFDFDENEHGFHYFQPPATAPADWLAPADYYNGTWQLRFEIFSQATDRTSNLQVCIWVDDGNETCSPHTPVDGPGSVVTTSSSPSTWWTMSGPVDFAHPELWDRLGMPLWNDEPCVVSDWSSSFCWDDRFDYFPMRIRLTVVAVSAGSTFSGWDSYIFSPSVQITEPADGAYFALGSVIPVTAVAGAPYAAISGVDLLQGTTLLGSDPAAPYEFEWTDVPLGTFSLIAWATDMLGGSSEDQVTITVGAGASGGGGSGGSGVTGGAGGAAAPATNTAEADDGCSCRTAGQGGSRPTSPAWLAPWLLLLWRSGGRRRR